MASLRSILTAKPIVRPQQITRYNDLRTVTFNGTAPAGAPAAMERVSQQVLPPDFNCEWTGTALEQQAAAGRTLYILAIAAMFAYLFLVSLYESWASRSRCCSRSRSVCSAPCWRCVFRVWRESSTASGMPSSRRG